MDVAGFGFDHPDSHSIIAKLSIYYSQNNSGGGGPPPPPVPSDQHRAKQKSSNNHQQPQDPDYEVIEFSNQQYSNAPPALPTKVVNRKF